MAKQWFASTWTLLSVSESVENYKREDIVSLFWIKM